MSMKKSMAVCGCLIDEGRVLLEWRKNRNVLNDVWVLPGGKVEVLDFRIEDAIIREMKEETDLDVSVMYELPDFYKKVLRARNGDLLIVELHVFRITSPGAYLKFPAGDEFVWYDFNALNHNGEFRISPAQMEADTEAFILQCLELDETWELYPEEMQ